MKVGIFGRIDLDISINLMKKIVKRLEESGVEVILERSVARKIGGHGKDLRDMDPEYLITVGGDGTILRASLYVDCPILPIKAGNLGFLTEVKLHEVDDALDKFLKGNFQIDERSKLDVIYGGDRYSVTNEVALKGRLTKLNRFNVRVPGEGSHRYRADGLVISTSTGSTGYSFSLGGPVIYPKLDVILICPIAPFRDVLRSIVVPADMKIEIEICENLWFMVLDGQLMKEYKSPGKVFIEKSQKKFKIVRIRRVKFLDDLNEKFHV